MKVRVVRNRRGIHVHGFHCAERGSGTEEVAEAQTAIGIVDALEEDVSDVLFYPCAIFGSPSESPPPTIAPRASKSVKMDTLATWAEENDWEVDDDGDSTLILARAEETLRLIFDGPRYNARASGYAYNGSSEYLPDLRAVLYRISGEAGVPVSTASRRTEDLPWDDDASDEEIVDHLVAHGAKIVWVNSLSGAEESDIVPMMYLDEKGNEFGSRHTRVHENSRGDRILSFCSGGRDGGGGWRSVKLDQILKVS